MNIAAIPKAIVATIAYVVTAEVISMSTSFLPDKIELAVLEYYRFLQGTIMLLVVLLFILLVNINQKPSTSKSISVWWYLTAAIIGISFVLIQSPLNWLYDLLFHTEYQRNIVYDFSGIKEFNDINIIGGIIFIPIAEELFFRGYIQKNLKSKLLTWVAVLTSTILFALIHAPYDLLFFELEEFAKMAAELDMDIRTPSLAERWHQTYIVFFGGLISAILFSKTDSVKPSILFHIFWNLTVKTI